MTKLGCFHNDDLIYREIKTEENELNTDTLRNQLFIENLDFFEDLGIDSIVCNTTDKSMSTRNHNRCEGCSDLYRTSLEKGYVWFTITDKGLINVITEHNDGGLEKLLQFLKDNFPEWTDKIVDVLYRHRGSNWYYLTSIYKILKGIALKKPCPFSSEDLEILSKRSDNFYS